MKKIHLISLMAAGLIMGACTNTELEPLKGVFPAPTELALQASSLKASEAAKDDAGRRIFDIDFELDGTAIHFKLVGDKYFLAAGTYTEAIDAIAKKGNFITGVTKVGGKKVKQGTVQVEILKANETKEGTENEYKINAVLFLEDGTPYKINWTGSLSFEKDKLLEPEFFFTASAPAPVTNKENTVVAGVKNITLKLSDKNGAFAAQFSLILPDGVTAIAGSYTVKEYASDPYSAGNGFDMSPYGMPFVIGSYYAKDGANVVINAGEKFTITPEENGLYTIEGSTGYSFLMAPEGWVPGGAVILSEFLSLASYTGYGIKLAGMELGTKGFSYTVGADYKPVYSVDGNYLKLELYTEDGTIKAGTYKACAVGGTVKEGEFGIGYDGSWGASGSAWYTVANGVATYKYITDGEAEVSVSGEEYTIKITSSVVTAQYTGKLSK